MDATDKTQEAGSTVEAGDRSGMPWRLPFVLGVLLGIGGTLVVAVLLRPKPALSEVPVVPPDLLAEVGGRWILRSDFEREMRRRGGAHPQKLDKDALLAEMIQREAFLAKAEKMGLIGTPDVERQRDNIVIGELRRQVLEPRLQAVEVTEDEARQHYEGNTAAFTKPGKRRLAAIYIKTYEKMTEEKLSACKALAEQAREAALKQDAVGAGRGFGKLAIQYSEDQATRYKGGDAGWFTEGRERYRWPAEAVAAGYALAEVGDVSDVIVTPTGLYVVKLLDQRSSSVTPFSDVTARIRHTLVLEKRKQVEQAFREEAQNAVDVRIREEVLDSIALPKPASAPARQEPPALP